MIVKKGYTIIDENRQRIAVCDEGTGIIYYIYHAGYYYNFHTYELTKLMPNGQTIEITTIHNNGVITMCSTGKEVNGQLNNTKRIMYEDSEKERELSILKEELK